MSGQKVVSYWYGKKHFKYFFVYLTLKSFVKVKTKQTFERSSLLKLIKIFFERKSHILNLLILQTNL